MFVVGLVGWSQAQSNGSHGLFGEEKRSDFHLSAENTGENGNQGGERNVWHLDLF